MDDWERDLRANHVDRTDESWILAEDSALLNEGVSIDTDGCRAEPESRYHEVGCLSDEISIGVQRDSPDNQGKRSSQHLAEMSRREGVKKALNWMQQVSQINLNATFWQDHGKS
jgi:hypothetical protein